ncbi:ABC transporter, periplasmic binding protein [Sulfurimonas gotlandica GD1]|jgi:iron complex transport system substrate-binding protein|uniref:ABC transporter, periplasmic binding protein n=1 Tax=Sulfurimonas gotlandica (strain DSM 19862 / JCM 16533 / GD1) TaxID=929558 RepID=B6BH80_SULGG|nr:helical backbone metal receptor [Sulfurimonas gotlandica]EDZ63107.1 periplasmic binding protein [Sulfurimonas gotlandica GD1]EHP29869.1 ABC transporter, periplasmic binding protein [Sulfurimonas gotlandica GD1]
MSIKTFLFILFFTLNLWANERIISLSPSITEIVYALDKGSSLVGTSTYSLHPKEAQNLPIVGNYSNPNIEKILALAPTVVVGQDFNQGTLDKLKYFKIKTVMLNLNTIENIKKSINAVAKEINSNSNIKLIKEIDNEIKNASKNKTPHSVMIVYGLRDDLRSSIYIAGHGIFFEDIIRLSGNTNAYITTSTEQPVLSYENIIAINPDQIIILHSHATEPNVDVIKALKAWQSIPTNASRNNNISIVDENYLHIPSHRVALTIKKLSTEMNKNYRLGN